MTEDVALHLIKETQTLLGKYIKEPPLTEKLLKKPPFRFLQDIVKSVVKETGFLSDVFSPDELSENIKEKEKKIIFLKKLIGAIQDTTGSTVSARPSKIVAGLEVTKTLELLQLLAAGVAFKETGTIAKPPANQDKKDKKKPKDVDSKELVKKSKGNKNDGKEESAKEKTKKKRPDSKEGAEDSVKGKSKEINGEKYGKNGVKKKEKVNEDEKTKKESPKETVNGEKLRKKSAKADSIEKTEVTSKERPSSRKRSSEVQEQDIANIPAVPIGQDVIKESSNPAGIVNRDAENIVSDAMNTMTPIEPSKSVNGLEENKENEELPSHGGSRKSSLEGPKEKQEKREKSEKRDKNKEGTAAERKTSSRRSSSKARQPSSKNTEPSAREKRVDEELAVLGSGEAAAPVAKIERPQTARKPPPSARPPSARPGVPKARDRGEVKTEVIEPEKEVKAIPVITDGERLLDDENTVTVERQAISPDFETQSSNFIDAVNKVGENEGALVAQILETKKELEETGQIISGDSSNQKNVEIEWEGGRKQKKEAWSREIAKLRDGIQQLTKSTNPLGKLFDFLQEDVDSMQRELKMWRETNASYSKQLENERRLTDTSLETYRRQLAELDSLIDQEAEALRNIKANVLANDRKIYSLLTKTSIE